MSEPVLAIAHVRRPLGVWVLTFINALFIAPYPLIVLDMVIFPWGDDYSYKGGVYYFLFAFLAAYVSIFGAWLGSNRARIAMLVLFVTYLGFLVFLCVAILLDIGRFFESGIWLLPATLLVGVSWLGLNYWYFLGSRTRDFYSAWKTHSTQFFIIVTRVGILRHGRQMPGEVHRVVKNAQNVDEPAVLGAAYAKYQEMAALMSITRDMKQIQPGQTISLPHAYGLRPLG